MFDPVDPSADWMDVSDIDDGSSIEVVDELVFDDVVDEGMPYGREPDAFETLVHVLEDALAAQGEGPHAIACLRALLGMTRMEDVPVDHAGTQALVQGGLLVQGERGVTRSGALTRQVTAWRGVLLGENEDFEGCADRPLDEWAADLVARVAGIAGRADGVRRDLRRRGVAAFGLIPQAA